MADDTEYISDLEPILELAPTDSFPVETLEGTKRIEFKDVILGPDNISFYEEVATNTLAIVVLSSEVLDLDASVTNINSGLTGLSAAYDEAIKSGFCYVSFNDAGTLSVLASSSNVAGIISTDGGSRIQITGNNVSNLIFASINVTLNNNISASTSTDDFLTYTPVIDSRTSNTFKVGINSVLNHFTTVSLPTAINVTSEAFSPITSLNVTPASITPVTQVVPTSVSVLLNPTGNGNVVESIAVTNLPSAIVETVTGNTTTKNIVSNVAVTDTSFNLSLITDQGSGLPLRNTEINISFRYR
jgi:hypothetical protein